MTIERTLTYQMNRLAALGAGLLTLGVTGAAAAQEECGDITCDVGTTCEMGQGICPEVLCLEDDPDCASDCDQEYYYCQPAACESDADCAEYMKCITYETRECPDEKPDCSGLSDKECEDVWQEFDAMCEPAEVHECGISWHQPCEAASDCGDGFECIPFEDNCSCDGAAAPADGEEPAPDRASAEGDCVCEPAEGGYCQAIEQACESDDDCLDHWTCEANYGGLCSVDSEGNEDCPEPDPAMICAPPQLASSGGDILVALEAGAADGAAGPSAAASAGPIEEPAIGEADGDNAADRGDVKDLPMGNADESAQSGVVDIAELSEDDGEGSLDDDGPATVSESESSSDSGGCSVASGSKSGGAFGSTFLLLGLGLAMGARRRRHAPRAR